MSVELEKKLEGFLEKSGDFYNELHALNKEVTNIKDNHLKHIDMRLSNLETKVDKLITHFKIT